MPQHGARKTVLSPRGRQTLDNNRTKTQDGHSKWFRDKDTGPVSGADAGSAPEDQCSSRLGNIGWTVPCHREVRALHARSATRQLETSQTHGRVAVQGKLRLNLFRDGYRVGSAHAAPCDTGDGSQMFCRHNEPQNRLPTAPLWAKPPARQACGVPLAGSSS
jgi:hypothetical protein